MLGFMGFVKNLSLTNRLGDDFLAKSISPMIGANLVNAIA